MKRTAAICVALAFSLVCSVYADFGVTDSGTWPKSWPKELEPLRKQARTFEGPMLPLLHHAIPFTKRDEFESAWPHLLKIKSQGAPIVLRRGPSFWQGDKATAGVCVHTPPTGEAPIADGKDAKGNWEKTIYIELIADGEIIDLNRIPLPADTPIIDERFGSDPVANVPPPPMNVAPIDQDSSKKPASLIAAVPPQERGQIAPDAAPASVAQPKHKDARSLYEIWLRQARANGDIPGAMVGELAAAVRTFIRYNPTWETVPKLNEILPRLDATRDWKPADAIALLDEVAVVKDSPLSMATWRGTRHTIRNGEALPKKFADASWGDAQPNGLRAAWVLEPVAAEHRIGAALMARLLVWNAGAVPVMLQVPTWHQGGVKASDAKGAEVEVSSVEWTTLAEVVPVRLGPGEFIEIYTPGVGLGPRAGMGPWAGPRIGSNVLAKLGDELTLTHSLVPLDGSEVGVSEDAPHVSGPGWWLAHIKACLNRDLPLPADAAERTRLLDRAVRELFATAPSAEETAAFVADKTPDALDALAKRLATRADVVSFSGKLQTAAAKFPVLAADANADKQPRVVLGPGEYPLSTATPKRGRATLKIVGRPVGDRSTNDAQLLFEAVEATGKLPPDPHQLEVPDGWGTWAIACRPNSGVFYLLSNGAVRKIDYSNPLKATDTPANDLPDEFRDEVKRQLDIHEISEEQQAEILEKPAAPAATPASKTGAN